MNVLPQAPDFVYGNTRLRARKAELLKPADFDALLGRDLQGLEEQLSESAYRPDLEAALAVATGTRVLTTAIRDHLARSLEEMRSFYDGGAREAVDVLLARFDLHNLLALVRGQVRAQPRDAVLASIVPLGPLGDGAAEEVASRDDAEAAVDLLTGWRLPDADTASALARSWPRYERTQDLAELEHELAEAHAARVERALGGSSDALRESIARERDATNLLTVLRLRAALQREELSELPPVPAAGRFLAGGRVAASVLETALHLPARSDSVAALAAAAHRADWQAPLERYADGGDLLRLQRELEGARLRWALRLFLSGDPLGVDVPVAFTVAKANEGRNLRLVVEGAAADEPPEAVRARLLLANDGGRWAA